MMNLFDLKGKVALITGGTHGIGMAIAKGLAAAGAKICVNDIFAERLAACKEEYAKAGIDVFTVVFDVTKEEDVDRGISTIEKEVGPVDILVNNAGVSHPGSILDAEADWVNTQVDVNLRAVLHLCRLLVPGMVARDCGHVINITSIAAIYNFNGNSIYHATKAGVHALSRQLRVDCYGKRVRITEICPGRVATEIFGNVSGDHEDARRRFIDGFELPEAKDIADCVAFALAAPVAVNIGNIEITPTLQVPGGLSTMRPGDRES